MVSPDYAGNGREESISAPLKLSPAPEDQKMMNEACQDCTFMRTESYTPVQFHAIQRSDAIVALQWIAAFWQLMARHKLKPERCRGTVKLISERINRHGCKRN